MRLTCTVCRTEFFHECTCGGTSSLPCPPDECPTCAKPRADVAYATIANDVAVLVAEKQTAYGDSFSRSGDVLRELYPDGVKPEQYTDLLTITRVLDKLFRVANKKDAFGESPWKDVLGYAMLAVKRDMDGGAK